MGADHPDTLISIGSLAVACYAAGRIDDAIRLLVEALPLCKVKLGPGHFDSLVNMGNLAFAYRSVGR